MTDKMVRGRGSNLGYPDWDRDEKSGLRRCLWDSSCEEEEAGRNPNFLVWETGWRVVGVIH